MPEIIKQEYRVTQALDRDEVAGPFDFQEAGAPDDPAGYVEPVASEEAAIALMQSCFEAERMQYPETQPDDFRIERVTVTVLNHQPVVKEKV